MAEKAVQFDELVSLALGLSATDRLKLVERIVSSVERELEAPPSGEEPHEGHWGQNLLRLLDELGPIDLIHPEIEDPVEWVKQIRQEQDRKRLGDWGEQE